MHMDWPTVKKEIADRKNGNVISVAVDIDLEHGCAIKLFLVFVSEGLKPAFSETETSMEAPTRLPL